jgi:predicted ester cyclase
MRRSILVVFAVLVVLILTGCASTQAVREAEQNKNTSHAFLELFMSGEWNRFNEVIAEDCVLHYPGGVDVVGLEAIKEGWDVTFSALTELNVESRGRISEGDILMELRVFVAVFVGDFRGEPVNGTSVRFTQVEMTRYEDGRIVEWWVEQDQLWQAQQLGMSLVW